MPNWRAIRTLTPWALAADPPERQTSAASNNARRRARGKLGPVKASSRPACFSFPGAPVPPGMCFIIFDRNRLAQVATGGDGRGASLRPSMLARHAPMPTPAEHIAFAPFSYDCRAHGRNSASRTRAPHHLFCARRLSARRALRAAQYRDPLLRAADAPRTRGADRRGRRAGGIRPVAQRAARPREELALHPVDRRDASPERPRKF